MEAWTAIIAAWEESGLSASAFARSVPGLNGRTLRTKVAEKATADALELNELRRWAKTCTCRMAAPVVSVQSAGPRPTESHQPIGCSPSAPVSDDPFAGLDET